jgi:hypothetical protein
VECDPGALLRLMAPALRDPGTVLAVTGYVERRPAGDDNASWRRAADDYQRLASIRSWMASRLAWHQLRCGVPPREGVVAWRRDALLDLGGFSTAAADGELDLLVRLQTSPADGAGGRVVRTSEVFGHAAAISVERHAVVTSQRQRAVLQALRTFWAAPGAGSRLTLMLVLTLELMTPGAQVLVVLAAVFGALTGLSSWPTPFYAALMLTCGYGVVSSSALLLRGGAPDGPVGRDLVRLLLRAPLEFAVYRPVLVWKRVAGSNASL